MDDQQHFLHTLNRDISYLQNVILTFPSPSPGHACLVQLLALALINRYSETRQQDDLEQTIFRFTEAIFLPAPWNTSPLNNFQIFFYLALAILCRAQKFQQPRDVKSCLIYFRYLRGQWYKIPVHLSVAVTASLVRTLAVHVKLDLGDMDQGVEEMADLCDELLDSDISAESLGQASLEFVGAVNHHLKDPLAGKIPSDKVIGCLRRAHMRLPDLHDVSTALADCLLNRFFIKPSVDDYNEAMLILDEVISFRSSGDRPSPCREKALESAALFAYGRFTSQGKPEHLEETIYRFQTLLDCAFPRLECPWVYQKILSNLHGWRLKHDKSLVITNSRDPPSMASGSSELPSFQDLSASLLELDPAKPFLTMTSIKHFDALYPLQYPFTKHLTDLVNIEDGIKYCRQVLTSHPFSPIAPMARSVLPDLLHRAFECTDQIEYLNGAISAARDHLNIADVAIFRVPSILKLQMFLKMRFHLLHRREDLNEFMQLWPIVAKHERSTFAGQFTVSSLWPSCARALGHPSTSTAYEFAMSSLQDFLTFAPTVDNQHSQLVKLVDKVKTIPLDYASFQIHSGRIKQAIETLERGRALLWSEMRGLRTSIDRIRSANPRLAEQFAAVNSDLEVLALSFSSHSDIGKDGGDSDFDGVDPFGHLVMRQRKLLYDRDKLISQIQTLPGLETFSKPPSFDTLRSAACRGPVVIINHSEWRSDIIILVRDSPPSLITTPGDFYSRAGKLQEHLLNARKKGLESHIYEDALRSVLKDLYDLVGAPVINRLNELAVPEQSRIWWCPTSIFCSLPLHAMGPIPSDLGHPRYFLDLYIPSYIPSLSALIESRKSGSRSAGKPAILLITQPDEKMPQALKEMKVVQSVGTQVTTLFSAKATPAAMLVHLQNHPFAHIVCHGILEPGRPFEASFKLHKGRRLQLLDIVRSQLPNAEFAFLSACHTAGLTDESIADEVLHLAAAMQFCGFRSVVGTMWAMADIDGRDLARDFYEALFSGDEKAVEHYNERTAEALRDAVKKLQRKGGISLERWVNFVHYGA